MRCWCPLTNPDPELTPMVIEMMIAIVVIRMAMEMPQMVVTSPIQTR